jgi:hypothetical protein
MSSSSTKNPKEKAGKAKKTMNLSGNSEANVGIIRTIADRKKLTPRRNMDRAGTTSRSVNANKTCFCQQK